MSSLVLEQGSQINSFNYSVFQHNKKSMTELIDVHANINELTTSHITNLKNTIIKTTIMINQEKPKQEKRIDLNHNDLYYEYNNIRSNDITYNSFKYSMREVEMMNLKRVLSDIHKEFIIVSLFTFLISSIGLIVFAKTGFYFIHPSIYILGIAMGLGWGVTAITSILNSR